MTERQLQAAVTQLCIWLGLLCYHTFDSRHSAAGFPDLVIVGPRGVLFRELKSDTGKITRAQGLWRDGLIEAGASYGVWTPRDWADGGIRHELDGLTARVRGEA